MRVIVRWAVGLSLLALPFVAQAQSCTTQTAGLKKVNLPTGETAFYGRLAMGFPEENQTDHSVRQIRIHLPLLQNDMPKAPASTKAGAPAVPLIQATVEAEGVGAGNAMLIYSIQRFEEDGCSALMIDAQTPQGQPSELAYFLNLTVIGTKK